RRSSDLAAVLGQRVEQAPHAGRVHLDADVVARGVAGGGMAKRLAVAEADLEDARGAAPEHRVEVARRAAVVEAEPRPQRIEGALLGGREAALPEHEAAHAAAAVLDREGLGRRLGP